MKTKLIIAAVVLTATFIRSEQFQLIDAQSEYVYGPFTYSNGTLLVVRGQELLLKRMQTRADQLEEKLKSIIIPSIEFRQANIADVVNFLVEASIAGDPEKVGASIILSRCIDTGMSPPASEDIFINEHPLEPKDNTTVTLNLRRVSLYDALSIITEVAGLKFNIDDRGVVILNANDEVVERNTTQTSGLEPAAPEDHP